MSIYLVYFSLLCNSLICMGVFRLRGGRKTLVPLKSKLEVILENQFLKKALKQALGSTYYMMEF